MMRFSSVDWSVLNVAGDDAQNDRASANVIRDSNGRAESPDAMVYIIF